MRCIGQLYVYEIKKIIKRKIVWIVSAVMLLLCIFLSFANLISSVYSYGDVDMNGYEYMKKVREYARSFSGRELDDTLLREMQESYREKAEKIEEYASIYMFVWDIMQDDELAQETDSAGLYLTRKNYISQNRADQMLTEKEIEYWEEKDSQIETPFIYEHTD